MAPRGGSEQGSVYTGMKGLSIYCV